MKRRTKASERAEAPTDRLVELFESLAPDRRGALLEWLEREDVKAKKPKRGPGRPRHMDEPMSDSITIKLPTSMRAEIRTVASALGCRNEAEYLRRLHRALLKVHPTLLSRGSKDSGARR